jgi:radical SAM superfamily enzyme YgiQ (UPF0313 family)
VAFYELCKELLNTVHHFKDDTTRHCGLDPQSKILNQVQDDNSRHIQDHKKPMFIKAPLPDLKAIHLPYTAFNDEDVAHRYIYVEASRGCPFECEFCLSSIDEKVRNFPTRSAPRRV